MTKERLDELKSIITQRTNYYSNIGFTILANEFTNVGNFLNEIENVIKENEELKTRVKVLEDEAREKMNKARAARDSDGEVYD